MSIEIRTLGNGDEAVLENVAPDVFDDPIDVRAATEFLCDPHHHLVVALDGGLVVGFVSAVLYVHPDKPRPELWINEVGVAVSHQRRGLGRKMLGQLLDEARKRDCTEAWVLTNRSNTAAMQLYSSLEGEEADDDQVMFTFHLDVDECD